MATRTTSGRTGTGLRLVDVSISARYAIRGMSALARASAGPGQYLLAEEAARRESLPASFLSKIFQKLAHRGLLLSRRGPGGGYALAKPADKLSLVEIVFAASEGHDDRPCMLRPGLCGHGGTCEVHEEAAAVDERLRAALSKITLADIANTPA